MIQFGNDKIKDIYVGSDKIKEVYYGSEKVWGEIEPIQEGYWVHKDTGVITYFDADADFITDGIMSSPPWRNNCSEVNIPEGVTNLGNSCFSGSESLTSINIPEGVISLGISCFSNCTSLTSITLPESVTSIGGWCFSGCTSLILATVLPTIPPTLGGGAFYNVHTSFNIKVNSPYGNDYKTATNWNQYASIITGIQDGYWVNKYSGVKTYFWLEDPSIAGGIMNSPYWRYDCSEVNIPEGVTNLGNSCFADCTSLTSITLPEGVTSLDYSCFAYCEGLASINIPKGVTSLGMYCFEECLSLTSITLPKSVDSLGEGCFYFCAALTLLTSLPVTPPTIGSFMLDGTPASLSIKVPSSSVNAYKTATNWTEYESIISAI